MQHKLQLEEEERRNSQASVWSARVAATPEEAKKEITDEAPKKEEQEAPKKEAPKPSSRSESPAPPQSSEPVKAKYVPPAMRYAAAAASDPNNLAPVSMASLRSKPKDKSTPKLDCQEEFPSLGD